MGPISRRLAASRLGKAHIAPAPGIAMASAALLLGLLVGAACRADSAPTAAVTSDAAATPALRVVTTVSPLRNIVQNVGGDRITLTGLVPEGINSHTFELPPSAGQILAEADLIVINGLHLEQPTLELAVANAADATPILQLGDRTLTPGEYVFDFSFPKDLGNPNPHLWTAPHLAIHYVELVAEALIAIDPAGEQYYTANLDRFRGRIEEMDGQFQETLRTIPSTQRKLLTYHDSFPYFAPRYGLEIIGAVQPSDFSDPSPKVVANLIRQVRAAGVSAIFGSEVFNSEVLETIAGEAGAVQISTLLDDDLPGETGDPENTYIAMMVENVRTITLALGGDASGLDGFDIRDTWIPDGESLGS